MGSLTIIAGCMYAGKTTKLIDLATKYLQEGKEVRLYKPGIDNRYHDTKIMSHDGVGIDALIVELLNPAIETENVDAVFIDEVQFFDPALTNQINEILKSSTDVVVSGLSTDFRGEAYEIISKLMPHADAIYVLHAKCQKCGAKAQMTQRLVNGKAARYTDPVLMVGGAEAYEARCKDCHEVIR